MLLLVIACLIKAKMNSYELSDMSIWQCRSDATFGDFFCHNVISCNVLQEELEQKSFALVGFSSDLGVQRNFGRIGAKSAPNIIRRFMSRLAIPYIDSCYDCGNVVVDNNSLLSGQKMLACIVSSIVKSGIVPIVLGGGHETAYGHYLGLMSAIDEDIAILNFDAHFDLRTPGFNDEGNSGTSFRQIYNACQKSERNFNYYCVGIQQRANVKSLYDFAAESKCVFIEAQEFNSNPQTAYNLIEAIIAKHKHVYVTICLDVFHYSFAPGVSAPQPLGINPYQIIGLLHLLRNSRKVRALDIVELNPLFDIDNHTARLAASLVGEFYYPSSSTNN